MSGPAFHIAGIPVRVDVSFLLVAVFLGWGVRSGGLLLAWVAVVTASVLLHELGHAFAFRRFGQEPQILLQGLGGLTSGSGEALPPRRDIVVSLAGPLAALVLLGLPALLVARADAELSPTWETIVSDIVFVNLAWSIANLLPILPLDGGRVAAALWDLGTGGNGRRQAHVMSIVVAGAGAVAALAAGYFFGALFAGFFCAYNVSQLTADRNQVLGQRVLEGWRSLAAGDTRGAAGAAEEVLADRPSRLMMLEGGQLLAWARLADGNVSGAEAAVRRLPHGARPDPFLQAALDLESGRTGQALEHLVGAYREQTPSPASAMVADALARNRLVESLADLLLAPGGPGPAAAAELAAHLHAAGRFDEAAEVGARALEVGVERPERAAYNVACSAARAGHGDRALDWLERAAALGFDDGDRLDNDPDLAGIRSDQRFRTLRERMP